jgi:hypothetical protein
MLKRTATALLIIFMCHSGQAQYGEGRVADADTGFTPSQALVDSLNPRKSLLVPVAEAVGMNLALGAFNAYVTKSAYAKISFKTIGANFESGWTTDADKLVTNMFAHPIHGSIYYNFARSSGYDYFASLGVAAIGSWQWEYFMENEHAALNDWIMTSVGGSLMGETFYRLSNLILDESTGGSERVWREIGAGVFNPGRLFNRLLSGQASRVTSAKLYETAPSGGVLAFGMNNVADGTKFKGGEKNGMMTFEYLYGRLFEKHSYKPFDFFHLHAAINFSKQPGLGQFRLYGIICGKNSTVGDKNKFLWGVFQHFDYLENNIYQIGGTAVGLGIGYRTSPDNAVRFAGTLHGSLLLMGAANSDYAPEYKVAFLDSARTFNMGPGAQAKLDAGMFWSWGSFYLGYTFWWIHTWDGAPGDELIGIWTPRLRIDVYGPWSLGLEYLLYHREGKYDQFPDKSSRNNEQRLAVGYAF